MSAPIIIAQLNRSQWHVLIPGRYSSGVCDYVSAVSDGITWGRLDRRQVDTVGIDGVRRTLALEGLQ